MQEFFAEDVLMVMQTPVRNSSSALAALSRRRSGLKPAGIIQNVTPLKSIWALFLTR
jgi:hypothetical protein